MICCCVYSDNIEYQKLLDKGYSFLSNVKGVVYVFSDRENDNEKSIKKLFGKDAYVKVVETVEDARTENFAVKNWVQDKLQVIKNAQFVKENERQIDEMANRIETARKILVEAMSKDADEWKKIIKSKQEEEQK